MDSSVSDISWRLLLLKFCTNRRSEKKQQQHILYNTDNAKQAGKSLALPAFLSNRTQSVLCEGSTSSPQTVISGVPQGTVLGPLRFAASRFLICPVICLLYRRINTTQDTNILQSDLNNLQTWEARNGKPDGKWCLILINVSDTKKFDQGLSRLMHHAGT